ncbi:MAG: ComEC/Rec2 family competence protein [Planctomycetes bacterium]|nr:ComEC/Rec2 family competence protein [Planctomycetota bacterium]MCB9890680.1 ComEC/Rec2 family competence protein [Planctomycetota bacterium]MCB9920097.1 ComEC/Rec2 family competence protein [Planctomycetota bacterium]
MAECNGAAVRSDSEGASDLRERYRSAAPVVSYAIACTIGLVLGRSTEMLGVAMMLVGFLVHERASRTDTQRRTDTQGELRERRRRCLFVAAAATTFAAGNVASESATQPPFPEREGLVAIRGVVDRERGSSTNGRVTRWVEIGGTKVRMSLSAADSNRLPKSTFRVEGSAYYVPATRLTKARLIASAATLRYAAGSGPSDLRASLHARIERVFGAASVRARGFIARLLFGRGELEPGDERAHRVTGLAHLLAISGLHAVFIAGLVRAMLGLLPVRSRQRFTLLCMILVCYAWLCENRAPVVRAVSGYLVYVAARARGRGVDLSSVLAIALLINLALFDEPVDALSLHLSFAAVIGIVVLGRRAPRLTRSDERIVDIIATRASDALRISFAAWLATAALVLDTYGCTSPWSIVWTPIAAPGVLCILAFATITAVIAMVIPATSSMLVALLDPIATLQLDLVSNLANVQGPPNIASAFPPSGFTGAVLLIGAALAWLLRSRSCFAATCALAIMPFFVVGSRGTRPEDRVIIHAVGHGQCIEASLSSKRIVIDCGDRNDGRIALRRIGESLRRSHDNHIDVLILTHGDADHVAGLTRLLDMVRVERAVLPEAPKLGPCFGILRRAGVRVELLTAGREREVSPGCRVFSLLASSDLAPSNDGGLACRLTLARGARVLVFGDQEDTGLVAAVQRFENTVDAVILPHHASIPSGASGTTAMLEMLWRLGPSITLASTSSNTRLDDRWNDVPSLRPYTPIETGTAGSIVLTERADGYGLEAHAVGMTDR